MDDPDVKNTLKSYEDEDGEEASEAFDMAYDLPRLYDACMSMSRWSPEQRLKNWTMSLMQITLMGRACDVCEFCPLIEDVLLPPEHEWDKDGYPQYIDLGMKDWKWRSKANKGKRYSVKAHRNRLDVRFCPVFWILKYLEVRSFSTHRAMLIHI